MWSCSNVLKAKYLWSSWSSCFLILYKFTSPWKFIIYACFCKIYVYSTKLVNHEKCLIHHKGKNVSLCQLVQAVISADLALCRVGTCECHRAVKRPDRESNHSLLSNTEIDHNGSILLDFQGQETKSSVLDSIFRGKFVISERHWYEAGVPTTSP